MKKTILIVDWLLLILVLTMFLSKFLGMQSAKVLQPIFFMLVLVHIIQHWRFFSSSIKKIAGK
ncbi:MAG TPA: hypothetical protein ENN13_04135 [Candidatus Altiarchaeales archaeon]|nr:hypothetical protein [Candidatus Altiarchaeales archaeon]